MTESEKHWLELKETIQSCLDLEKPKSFFLFAGAGTGKTRAVVHTLQVFRNRYGTRFRQSGQKVAVITYTNAACDEIRRRIGFDSIFAVSTIHSFAWEQIKTFQTDISRCLRDLLNCEVSKLREQQSKGRAQSKAAVERASTIDSHHRRLRSLDSIAKFTYNPNGDNFGVDSLIHTEVIDIFVKLFESKKLLTQILIHRHPVLLIDESQDTQKDLMHTILAVQAGSHNKFSLGLFGDMMQRVYSDGEIGLQDVVPKDWEKPALKVNYRCPKRIVALLNRIRSETDDARQAPGPNSQEGIVRLFLIADVDDADKPEVEKEAAIRMEKATLDRVWLCPAHIKPLLLSTLWLHVEEVSFSSLTHFSM